MSEPSKHAVEAAVRLHEMLGNLKLPSGWSVHPSQFLPANVECDYVGMQRFDRLLAGSHQSAIDAATAEKDATIVVLKKEVVVLCEQRAEKDKEIEWLRNCSEAHSNQMCSKDKRIAEMAKVLDKIPHDRTLGYPDPLRCHPTCPRCAWEKLKANQP